MPFMVFEATAPDIAGILTTATTSASSQIMTAITTVIPIALGVLGLVMALKIGVATFKSVTKQSSK